MNLTIFASGQGSNFAVLLERISAGDLCAHIPLLITNNSTCGAAETARKNTIDVLHTAPSHFTDRNTYVRQLIQAVQKSDTDYIILAGYMKKIPKELIAAYPNKIINIHPALLPAFGGRGMYGIHVHRAVLDRGVKITGITVHFVTTGYDEGPIIAQTPVYVADTDTPESLGKKIRAREHDFFWRVIQDLTEKKFHMAHNRVIFDE
jgi:phosphoribosylglycinamide formyltransferase-1